VIVLNTVLSAAALARDYEVPHGLSLPACAYCARQNILITSERFKIV
jgi:hypothetical protein